MTHIQRELLYLYISKPIKCYLQTSLSNCVNEKKKTAHIRKKKNVAVSSFILAEENRVHMKSFKLPEIELDRFLH